MVLRVVECHNRVGITGRRLEMLIGEGHTGPHCADRKIGVAAGRRLLPVDLVSGESRAARIRRRRPIQHYRRGRDAGRAQA